MSTKLGIQVHCIYRIYDIYTSSPSCCFGFFFWDEERNFSKLVTQYQIHIEVQDGGNQMFAKQMELCLFDQGFIQNKTNHPISSYSHPSATAYKTIHCLKWGGGGLQNQQERHIIKTKYEAYTSSFLRQLRPSVVDSETFLERSFWDPGRRYKQLYFDNTR